MPRRRKRTARELGALEVSCMANSWIIRGGGKPVGEYVQEDALHEIIETANLTSREEIDTYNNYVRLHGWLAQNSYFAMAVEQQTRYAASEIERVICGAVAAEEAREAMGPDRVEMCERLRALLLDRILDDGGALLDDAARDRAAVLDGIYWMRGFSAILNLIGEEHGIPAVPVAFSPALLPVLLPRIEAINNEAERLRDMIRRSNRADKEKVDLLAAEMKCFPPLDVEGLGPELTDIEQARADLVRGMEGFTTRPHDLINSLCLREKKEARR